MIEKKLCRPVRAKRILKLLEQARAKDADFERFGADSHQYELSEPASEEAIQRFEEQQGIRLPEEYRDFLLLIGNGGAGPHYGIYGLEELEDEISDSDYHVKEKAVIFPKMSDEDWDRIADPWDRREEAVCPYDGVLPIESQGCTLMTGLILNGPYRGRVVYYDVDLCATPFFMREKGFLAWYRRWLREVIAGYSDEETGFGMNVDGNPEQLMKLYEQTGDPEEKIDIIDSYYKFETLPDRQKAYFKQACARESNRKVRTSIVRMMRSFHVPEMTGEMERLWEDGAYEEAVFLIRTDDAREVAEAWYEKIFEILPELHGEGFRDACYTFMRVKDRPDVHAGRLKEALKREELDRNDRGVLFYCIRDLKRKEEVVDYFLEYLLREEDPHLLIYAIQAMDGVKDQNLQERYVKLLDQYKTHENAILDYEGSQMVLKNGNCMGAHRPEGQIVSNLMRQFDLFGLDYRGAWKLLMDAGRWKEWKQQNGFAASCSGEKDVSV